MKPIIKWYQELPEPQRSQAIENAAPELARKEVDSLSSALRSGFPWMSSPQGHDYWEEIQYQAFTLEERGRSRRQWFKKAARLAINACLTVVVSIAVLKPVDDGLADLVLRVAGTAALVYLYSQTYPKK